MKILILFLASLLTLVNCNNFTVQVLQTTQFPSNSSYLLRCFGALYNNADILVPASCINVIQPSSLRVIFQNNPNSPLITSQLSFFNHPKFNATNPNYGNIGRIRVTNSSQVYSNYTPRNLTNIPQNRTVCNVFGWTQEIHYVEQTLIQAQVTILPPVECGNDSPFTHCSFITEANSTICSFKLGSPLVCNNSTVAGYMVSDGCEIRSGMTIVRFNSALGAFNEWMQVEANQTTTTMATTTTPRTTTRSLSTTTGGSENSTNGIVKFLVIGAVLFIFMINNL
ncbi:hypothetical protein PVAND_015712 [Polypedilum vanderplanki]|uniref:Peptidase S1 domain-containing protein n=1 Tax=Polypedilum vanderplanki TaxID=319348 RepID=A0A9J6BDX6_POLVA|nr:hypothetical protein PVAND_015712 [Polypedilum vanderplanki]